MIEDRVHPGSHWRYSKRFQKFLRGEQLVVPHSNSSGTVSFNLLM